MWENKIKHRFRRQKGSGTNFFSQEEVKFAFSIIRETETERNEEERLGGKHISLIATDGDSESRLEEQGWFPERPIRKLAYLNNKKVEENLNEGDDCEENCAYEAENNFVKERHSEEYIYNINYGSSEENNDKLFLEIAEKIEGVSKTSVLNFCRCWRKVAFSVFSNIPGKLKRFEHRLETCTLAHKAKGISSTVRIKIRG